MNERVAICALLLCACSRTGLDDDEIATPPDSACSIDLASGPSWSAYTADTNMLLGAPLAVCLVPDVPATCPSGAFIYNHPGTSLWAADLSSIGDAEWIWRPSISLLEDDANLAEVAFSRTFELSAVGKASMAIAADDMAAIEVNGTLVGSVGSISDPSAALHAQGVLTAFDIASRLIVGTNTIRVIAQNGPFGCSGSCDYQENPAGVVFGGTIGCP